MDIPDYIIASLSSIPTATHIAPSLYWASPTMGSSRNRALYKCLVTLALTMVRRLQCKRSRPASHSDQPLDLRPTLWLQSTSALLPRESGNTPSLCNHADDTVNVDSRMAEIENIEVWACANNLRLNRRKAWKQSPPPAPELVMLCGHRLYCPTLPECCRWRYLVLLSPTTVSRRPRTECHHPVPVHELYNALRLVRVYGLSDPAL